ncbi:XdhC family protein [Nocardioides sp.]|uniref:XdhC family protein n=1 Tax=Nocardioides sp. TaxID=35761 RepID=UPI0039E6DD63
MTQWDPDGWDVLGRARELSEAGEPFALATVVWRQAPSSGHVGSRAIVTADGRMEGWIGGACAEPVVLREAKEVIASAEPQLLFLGTATEGDLPLPDGARFVAMSCQSEGALQIFLEPVVPVVDLVVIGDSPAATTLVALADTLGWRTRQVGRTDLADVVIGPRSVVVVATQGHGDEEAVEWAVRATPAFVGLVASRKRGHNVLGYLADRGVPKQLLGRVHTPVGLDLGHTSHQEIGVAVLAELVQLRAAGAFATTARPLLPMLSAEAAPEAIDPVCHMTVPADDGHWPHQVDGATYWFCCLPCHDRFATDPAAYLADQGV